ncbi:uncharacterized protein DSM5745_01319 [Aspergillus mulundensis]|uniref:Uncharacterized protein n=1 Tax=Aspergillus mulundensis TaxID=1810919 RepID=A0A3D8T613_9EURO|nr:hypothetical protein DSM5745_01319 [Aspergillus mulundensis]RDW93997.1 hypothetical protein DSM5745_01319 [Aspergillus mulundensis]
MLLARGDSDKVLETAANAVKARRSALKDMYWGTEESTDDDDETDDDLEAWGGRV